MAPALLALLAGCAIPTEPPRGWWDQPAPAGACWSVNLADGLDQASTDEIHALYDCVNQDGAFDALAGIDEAMDATSREGRPLGIEVALVAEGLGTVDLDLFAAGGIAVDLLRHEDAPIQPLLEAAVEFLYGVPYTRIENGAVTLSSESALDQGIVVPLLPAFALAAGAVLDDGPFLPELAADALESETFGNATCTLIGLAESTDDDVEALAEGLAPPLGAAIEAARSPENDRWTEASGDSLRDAAEALLLDTRGDGLTAIQALRDPVQPMLDDDEVRDRLAVVLDDAARAGQLEELPLWALHLASVDAEGEPLCDAGTTSGCSDGDSALIALLRLIDAANADVECSALGFSLYDGNFAVDLMALLADTDPETVESLTDLAAGVLGWDWSGDVLEWLLGACDGIADPGQFVADLSALDRLIDPDAGQLLEVVVAALGAVYDPDQGLDHREALVDTLSVVYGRALIPPVEEVLRDLAAAAIGRDLAGIIPLILDPEPLNVANCPEGSAPLDWDAVWGLLRRVTEEDESGRTVFDTLDPVLHVLLGHEGTWTAVGNLARLLQEDEATLHQIPDLLDALVAVDEEGALRDGAQQVLRAEAVMGPMLRIAENEPMNTAIARTELSAEGPLPFAARLVTGGTLETVLRTVDLLLSALEG